MKAERCALRCITWFDQCTQDAHEGGVTLRDTVGASGGLSAARQLYNRFDAARKPLKAGGIAIVDAALPSVRHLQ